MNMAVIGSVTLPTEPENFTIAYGTQNRVYTTQEGEPKVISKSSVHRTFTFTFPLLYETWIYTFHMAYFQTMPVSMTIAGISFTGFVTQMRFSYDYLSPVLGKVEMTIEEQP